MPPGRRCSRVPDVLVSLAEGPRGRADLARRRAITLQAGSHTGGPGTRSGPLLAVTAGQAARNGLCRPPDQDLGPKWLARRNDEAPHPPDGRPTRTPAAWLSLLRRPPKDVVFPGAWRGAPHQRRGVLAA